MFLADLSTSARACARVLPISVVSSAAALSTSASSLSAAARIHSARWAKVVPLRARKAAWDWAIRVSTSASVCGSNSASVWPVAGLMVAMAMVGVPFG